MCLGGAGGGGGVEGGVLGMSFINRFKSSQYDKPFQNGSSVVVYRCYFCSLRLP